jgi:hypothetical protein
MRGPANIVLRFGAALLTAGLVVAAANYYLELGWFGRHGRLVMAAATFLTAVYLVVAIRLWREDS